jgi:hypothetical protein
MFKPDVRVKAALAATGFGLVLAMGGAAPAYANTGGDTVAGLVAHAPLTATAWFLLTSLGGLIGFRWLRKD